MVEYLTVESISIVPLEVYSLNPIVNKSCNITVDFGEVKAAPTECKEKCFQMTSPAYLHFSKAP